MYCIKKHICPYLLESLTPLKITLTQKQEQSGVED